MTITELLDIVTRLEVIDHTKDHRYGGGRRFVAGPAKIKVDASFQDGGRTLKLFIVDREV